MAATCPDRAELSDFAFGKLDEQRIDTVTDHLEQCDECQTTVDLIAGGDDTFVEVIRERALADELADEPQFQAAMAQIEAIGHEAKPDDPLREEESPGRLREYELLAKLGEGGMGTVYKALHTRLRRVVALKLLATHRQHDPAVVERFAREIEAVGTLNHPNIVAAHDAGEQDGTHYLVMELVEGVDLHTLVAQHGPLPVADACEIIRQAALGLQHAHEHGLVHRDLKPSNLMLSSMASGGREPQGASRGSGAGKRDPSSPAASAVPLTVSDMERQPPDNSPLASSSPNQPAHAGRSPVAQVKILDLGLALLQGDHVASEHITATGQVMGTLDYMAPEQANDSHGVDTRADIYSLGCTLHKLLTGHAPFAGESFGTPAKKIVAHAQTVPPSVREHREEVPEELAVVIDTMLAKDPGARPATPSAVAALLGPFCEGNDLAGLASQVQPEPARDVRVASADEIPVMLRRRSGARDRGRRAALGILATAALLLLVAAAGVIITIQRPGKPATTVKVPEGSQVTVDPAGRVDVTLPADVSATVILPDAAAPWPVSSRVDRYGDPLPLGAVARVGTERFRHGGDVDGLSFSADGSVVASVTMERSKPRTRFWNVDSGRLLGQIDSPAHFLADGKTLAIPGLPGRLWDVREGRQVATLKGPICGIPALDGKTLIGESRSMLGCFSIYEASTGREQHVFKPGWWPLSVSPSGKLLAIGGDGADSKPTICIWDVAIPKLRWQQTIGTNDLAQWRVAFSPDDSTVAMLVQQQSNQRQEDGTFTHEPAVIGVFDARTGKQTLSLRREHAVTALTFAPDGKALAVAEFAPVTYKPIVQTWDVVANQPIRPYKVTDPGGPLPRDKEIQSLAFSPDGRTLVAGTSTLLHAWDVISGVERRQDHQYRQAVTMLAISPNGKSLATGTNSGTMQLWDLLSGTEVQELGPLSYYAGAAFSPDGRTLAASEKEGLRLYHSQDGRTFSPSFTRLTEDKTVSSVAISSDGRRLAALGAMVTLWQLPEKERLAEWCPAMAGKSAEQRSDRTRKASSDFQSPVFSPDAKLIAGRKYVGGRDRTCRFDVWYWDVETGRKLHAIQPDDHESKVAVLAFTPDSRMLMWRDKRHLHFHDVRTHREALKIEWNESPTLVSSDFRRIATAHHGDRIRVWDFATGRKLLELAGHSGPIQSLAFSPDGKYLVSGSDDTTALVWDLELARQELDERLGRADVGPPLDGTCSRHESSVSTLWVNPPGAAQADRAMWTLVAGGERAAEFLGERLSELKQRDEQPSQRTADTPTGVPADDHADMRRAKRAVMALERIGDGKAKQILEALAKPAAGEPSEPKVGRALLPVTNQTGKSARPTTGAENEQSPAVCSTASSDRISTWSQQALARIARRSPVSASQATQPPTDQGERLDPHGDPLPAGAITRFGTQWLRQGGSICDIAHVADGRLLASTEGNSIHLWDTTTGQRRHTLRGHETPVLHLAALGDGKTLVSCGNRTVRYWNVGQLGSRSRQDFGPDRTDQGAGSNAPDAETLASSATAHPSDIHLRSVDIPDVPEGYITRFFTHARDGSVFVCGINHPTYAGRTTIVVAIDRHTGKELRTFDMDYQYDRERHNRDILAMDVSPDGKHLAVAAGANTLDIWDVETGNRIHRRKGEGRSSSAVAYSPDGKWLVAGNDLGTSFFNARTHELERTIDAPVGYISNFVFSDNGAMLASHNNREYKRCDGEYRALGEIRLWDVGSGKLLRSMPTLDGCRGVSLSPDGSNLASRSERRIDLWNTATGEPLEIAGAHMGQVNDVVLSPDGESAATATNYSVHLWDAPTGTLRKTIWLAGSQPSEQWPYVGPIVFTPGGDLVISQQRKQIGLFSSDGQFRRSLYAVNGSFVQSMAILPEQNRLAFGVLTRAPGNFFRSPQTVVVLDLQTGETVQQFPCKRVGYFDQVCFLPCGDTFISRTLEAWDLSTGLRRFDLPPGDWYGVAASPDSRVLATLGHDPESRQLSHHMWKKVRLWDLISGQVVRDFKVPTQTVRLAVSPGGRIVATGSDDTTVRLWDAASGAELAVLEGHGSRIESLTFSSDGRRLATASRDHTALLWDLTPHLRKLKPPAPVPDDPMLHRSWQALACQLPQRPGLLEPAPLATPKQQATIERCIGKLDNKDVTAVLTAAARLEAMGYLAVPALQRELSDAESPAKRKRIESILAEIASPEFIPPDRHTTARAIRVLETVATDHARSVLEDLATGAPDAPRTKQAQAALERTAP